MEKQTPNRNRVTIMIDDKLDRKVRNYQAKNLKEISATFSYSRAVNELVESGLKSKRKINNNAIITNSGRRVTIMFDPVIRQKVSLEYAKHIKKCALDMCENPAWSFSKEVNKLLMKVLS